MNDDFISRKTAMNAFAEYVRRSNNSDFAPTPTWNDAVEIVENLPSAEPKRIKGRWIEMLPYMNHTYKCSECGRLLVNVTDGKNNVSKHYPYCHCGADMRGEKDG